MSEGGMSGPAFGHLHWNTVEEESEVKNQLVRDALRWI